MQLTSANEASTSSSGSSRSSRSKSKNIKFIVFLLAIVLAGGGIYAFGLEQGKKTARNEIKAEEERRLNNNPLLALPASGTVSKINNNEITIQLLGNEVQTAKIDQNTVVANKQGSAKISDVKQGGKVILFSKEAGDDRVATKIMIQ